MQAQPKKSLFRRCLAFAALILCLLPSLAFANGVTTWGNPKSDKGLSTAEVTIKADKLTPDVVRRAKALISSHGIAFVVLPKTTKHQEQLSGLMSAFGFAARAQQNTWTSPDPVREPGKKIVPKWDSKAASSISGDTANMLGLHVDGTQHTHVPDMMIFKYAQQPKGTTSRWVDMAHVMENLSPELKEKLMTDLAHPRAGTASKKGITWRGPMVTAEPGTDRLRLRTRFDHVLVPRRKAYASHLTMLNVALDEKNVYSVEPPEGAIVIFDNTRLLHARGDVTGPRTHYRIWAEANPNDQAVKLGVPASKSLVQKVAGKNSAGRKAQLARFALFAQQAKPVARAKSALRRGISRIKRRLGKRIRVMRKLGYR